MKKSWFRIFVMSFGILISLLHAADLNSALAKSQDPGKKKPDLADQIIEKYKADAQKSAKLYGKGGGRAFVTEAFTCDGTKLLEISTTATAYAPAGERIEIPVPYAELKMKQDGYELDYVCCGTARVTAKGLITSILPHDKKSEMKKCPVANFNKKKNCPKVGAQLANSPPFFGFVKKVEACCAQSKPPTSCYGKVSGAYLDLKNAVKFGGNPPSSDQDSKSRSAQ